MDDLKSDWRGKLLDAFLREHAQITEYAEQHFEEKQLRELCRELVFSAVRVAFKTHERKVQLFREAEMFGAHVLPTHFYSPLPTVGELGFGVPDARYDRIPGLELDRSAHSAWLRGMACFAGELADIPHAAPPENPHDFFWDNPAFCATDAAVYYAMIRRLRPRRIVEIGGGFSSLIALKALKANGSGQLICIEPFPKSFLVELAGRGEVDILKLPVQCVNPRTFDRLGENDILFIDSSHVCKFGSDVNFEMFHVLPFLRPGVVVHVHDIFLPWDFPREWIERRLLFWNEQYLLMAFLAFNPAFRVIFGVSFADREMPDEVRQAFACLRSTPLGGSSFWFQRLPSGGSLGVMDDICANSSSSRGSL